MRNTRWLRFGLASIIVAGTGLGAGLAACGDDSASGSSSGNVPETGTPDTKPGDTGAGPDAADGAPKPNFAKLTFVNGITDMGDPATTYLDARGDTAIRLCFKQGATAGNLSVAPYPPLPNQPKAGQAVAGVFPGTGGTFPSLGLDLEGRIIVPIVMNVRSLVDRGIKSPGNGQPGTSCDELVGDTADAAAKMVENTDYWILPQIDAGTFKKEKAYVLVLTGCMGDTTITNKDKCGANPPAGGVDNKGTGNLKVVIQETNRTPVSATQLGVQFLYASPQTSAIFGAGTIPFTPGFVTNPGSAGSDAGSQGFRAAAPGPVVLNTLTPAQGVTGVKDSDFFVMDKANPQKPAVALAPYPLPLIQALSGLGLPQAPTVYQNGANFVFLAVGDPTEPVFSDPDGGGPGDGGGDGTKFNTKVLHFLAFPTDPVIEAYKP